MRWTCVLIAMMGSVSRAAPATTRAATTQEMKAEERAAREAEVKNLAVMGPMKLEEALRVELEKKRVTAKLLVPASDEQKRVLISGEDSFCTTMLQRPPGAKAGVADLFQLVRWDFSDPSLVLIYTWASAHPGYTQLVATWDHGNEVTRQVTLLDQDATTGEDGEEVAGYLDLHVEEMDGEGDKVINVSLRARDLATMQREHPSEVNFYLRPMLRQLKAEKILAVDPKLAWQVFGEEKQADEKTTAKMIAILPKLDSSEYAQRQSAAEEIKKLGFDGVIALMHLDKSKLSAEQVSRVEEILAEYQSLEAPKAKELAGRVDFLLDCLSSEDAPIRQTAAKHLGEKMNQRFEFDVAGPEGKRIAQLDVLRRQLLAPPATQAVAAKD
jgi:hypothetical protein